MMAKRATVLTPEKVSRARDVVRQACVRHLAESSNEIEAAKRLTWREQAGNRELRDALLKTFGGMAIVEVIDGAQHAKDAMELALAWRPDPADPFSPAKVEAAQETYLDALQRAMQRSAGDGTAARDLLYAWGRQDAELRLAMVRLCIYGRVVPLPVCLPDRPEPMSTGVH